MADAALGALRAATSECTATATLFSPAQAADAVALADKLRVLFSTSTTTAAMAEAQVVRDPAPPAPLLPQLPPELIVEVLQHLDVRSLGCLACTCRQLYFGPPCPPRPMSLVKAAIRRRADEVGRWTPSSLPAGVSNWVPFLLRREWQSAMEHRTVAAGLDRSFFVNATGALLACGIEEEGEAGLLGLQRGDGQTTFTAVEPTPVPFLAGMHVRALACHEDCNLAVSKAGGVFEWGAIVPPSVADDMGWCKWLPPVPTAIEELQNHRVSRVVAGLSHCAALTEDGSLFTWQTRREAEIELGDQPELGYGSYIHDSGAPYCVYALAGERVTSVAVGTHFTVAVTEAGAVYSFGVGDGRLGQGKRGYDDVFLPKRIEALDGAHVVTVAAGDLHTLALTRCGRVYSWGGNGRDSPVHGLGNESDDGGDSDDGSECGDVDEDRYATPQLITALLGERVRALAAGPYISCAYTWGHGGSGNLGHGDAEHVRRPRLVQGLQGIRVVGVSICDTHTLALAADGRVYAFGEGPGLGSHSQGGEGEEADATARSPQRIPGLVCMVPQE
jgi:alpha-tubulin suppressor-like RCC1 family protein